MLGMGMSVSGQDARLWSSMVKCVLFRARFNCCCLINNRIHLTLVAPLSRICVPS